MVSRRDFVKIFGGGIALGGISGFSYLGKLWASELDIETVIAKEFSALPNPDYNNVSHSDIHWKPVSYGIDFTRAEVYNDGNLVDIIAASRIDPDKCRVRVFNGFDEDRSVVGNIEAWQRTTGATVMINSAQYMADPYYMPCALVMGERVSKGDDGQLRYKHSLIGPPKNKNAKGMLVSEPKRKGFPGIDLLDFDFDSFDYKTTPYTQGIQHWPILLDREGKIKVKSTNWQANRTIAAKDREKKILFMTTEGGYFTLYNLGRFLKDSNRRPDKGFNIHTAMNMDGGYEADMIVKSAKVDYVTYGEFETYGPKHDATRFNIKIDIPGVVGVFPRK